MRQMKTRDHKILDHPILGYFLLTAFAMIVSELGGMIDGVINEHALGIAGGGPAHLGCGIGTAVGALVALGLFKLWFRPDFKGCLQVKGLLTGILLLLPVLIIHYIGSIVSWTTFGTGSVFLAFLAAFAPGFSEEVAFRGLGVANYMRTIRSEKQIKVIFWLSAIVFGLIHAGNILAGGDVFACVVQTVYATGIGMALGAVYLRTGNLLPCILGHMSLDFVEFIRGDLSQSGGVMTGMGAGDWITVFAAAVGGAWGLWLIRSKYHSEIIEVWNNKWNKHDDTQYETLNP